MSETTPHPLYRLENNADQGKYLLSSRDQIIRSLIDLSKKTDLISAFFESGTKSILTTVVAALPERDLVILEYGRDNHMNRELLAEGTTICIGKHSDIDIRFQLDGLRNARYQGQQVFAAPIPRTLLRLQRREFYRAHTPLMEPIICHMHYQGRDYALPLADISIGGLALIDIKKQFSAETGVQLDDCSLLFPGTKEPMEVTLEVRASFMLGKDEGHMVRRIGCAFVELSPEKSMFIQRYINRLQIQQKNLA